MTNKEIKSCVGTIEMLRRLAYNIHGVMDVIDADNCEKIIKALEQEPKWIPVTERLPKEESNTYWVCTHNGCQCECRWTNVNPFWSYETTDWHWNTADIPQYTKVVAWMPLPKPYGLESEEV